MAAARVVSLTRSQHPFTPRSEQSLSLLLSSYLNFAAFSWMEVAALCVIPDVITFLGTEGALGDEQGVVVVTFGTVRCIGGADSVEVLTVGDNKVQLVPMLGSWVHPGYTVLLLNCKEWVGNAELVMCAIADHFYCTCRHPHARG